MTGPIIFDTIKLDAYPKKMKKSLYFNEDSISQFLNENPENKFVFKDLKEEAKRYIIPVFTTESIEEHSVIASQLETFYMFFDSIILGVIPGKKGRSVEIYTSHEDLETAGALASYFGFNRFYDKLQRRQIDCIGEYKTLGADVKLYWDKEDPKTKKEILKSNPLTDETSRTDSSGQHENSGGAEKESEGRQ